MKSFLVFALLAVAACADPESTPDARVFSADANPVCHGVPQNLAVCNRSCLTQVENFDLATDCCGDITCNCVPSTGKWELQVCDGPPPIDAGPGEPDAGKE
jgi:hypothetical protein